MCYAFSQRTRRAARCLAAVALFASVCVCSSAGFSEFAPRCQKTLESAWGHPSARQQALKLLRQSDSCPSSKRVSARGRAALIAANLITDNLHECYDTELAEAVRAVCGNGWEDVFKSRRFHSHSDGVRYFYEPVAHSLIAVIVAASVLVILLSVRKSKQP